MSSLQKKRQKVLFEIINTEKTYNFPSFLIYITGYTFFANDKFWLDYFQLCEGFVYAE